MAVLQELSISSFNQRLNILTGQIGLHVEVYAIVMEVNYGLDTANLKAQLKIFNLALVKLFNLNHAIIQSA